MRPVRREYGGQGYPPPMYGGQPGTGGPMGSPLQNGPMGSMQQQQQQHRQQQQQQMLQQQPQGGPIQGGTGLNNGGPSTGSDGQSNSANNQPEMNLANVLHYLQSEWRRWERDRNEWEIERAEMRARIALLEGQRRSAENLKVDLLRRVKMLEFALRQERSKATGRPASAAAAVPPSRLAALQDEDSKSRDEKEGSGSSEGGDDIAERALKTNGAHPGLAKAAITAHRPVPDTSAWKNLSGPSRDPKARARSREYLKQCLQEITYLTSPGALNPIPTRPPINVEGPSTSNDESNGPHALERPRKALPEQPLPSLIQPPQQLQQQQQQPPREGMAQESNPPTETKQEQPESSGHTVAQANGSIEEEQSLPPQPKQTSSLHIEEVVPAKGPVASLTAAAAETEPPSSPNPRTVALPEGLEASDPVNEEPRQVLTAIYRPESKAAWRESLRAANEEAKKAWPPRRGSHDEDQLFGLTLVDEEAKAEQEAEASSDRIWTTRRTLKSHLDVVRGVAIASGPDLILATGGDDCTVKVWSLDVTSVMSPGPRPIAAAEIEPIATYRGHTAGVTSVAISTAHRIVFSGSADSTVRLWQLPMRDHDPYAPYDSSTSIATLVGHTDVVWDVCLIPGRPERNGSGSSTNGKGFQGTMETQLISVSADGTARLWEERNGRWSLQSIVKDFGEGVVPTCVSADSKDYGRVLIGLSNGLVKQYSIEQMRELASFGEEGSQVNAILSHPTLPWVITGHEDGYLRFFDTKSSTPDTPTHSILAHPSPLTSLALSPTSPMCILSASVDCSVRFWDLQRKASLQDLSGHRQRSDEGVTHIASHPELPIVASAGADGVVRVWGAG